MGFKVENNRFNEILKNLKQEYKIYAPKRFEKRGRFSDTDLIKYGEISSVEEIVWNEKSQFSPKEVVYPITQTLFYFTEEEYRESLVHDKKILIFLRPCDINGMRRLDTIFLQNGPFEDIYYKRLREKVKFVMMECKESFDNCFCVSMNSNHTDNYSIAVSFKENEVYLDVKDEEFLDILKAYDEIDFKPEYVKENKFTVNIPDQEKITIDLFNNELWKDYAKRCIGCGRCNMSCITCSCFTTQDIAYDENPQSGERRRVWAGCHIDKFTTMAGGHDFRTDYGSRMRFKTMHKIYDYNKRFNEHMCVGCGRCDDRCPEYISFSKCINIVNEVLEKEENNNVK
ncbi:anaerobic sulfite reductase subunit AsrA [Alkalithermobacter paradoxus]|uniref:Anaerobic sulfite reductase subunit A n=1 Tax=Alkalithermobacter paradoxus TaxID=29349 RepID=A0A1V4I664_9FIRM|nr:anaerobic sulfite reductase subunit A [[Clostridium] thermoalcaliphilum]